MQPVVRALRLLTTLAHQKSALSLQELADLEGLPVSTVHRLVGVLQSEGFLVRSERGKLYSLGPAVRALVASTSSDLIRRVAEPVMRDLNLETHETVILVEIVGHDAVCIAIREGRRSLRMYVELGSPMPLHAASTARVLLAGLDDSTARSMLEAHAPLDKWTDRTITDVDEVMKHLTRIREQGYDVCDDEMENATWAVAAPLVDSTCAIRASLGIPDPLFFIEDPQRQSHLTEAVRDAATAISKELGATDLASGPFA